MPWLAHGRPVCWAVDVTTDLSALLLTLLWRRQVQVRYVSGTVACHMAAAFAGGEQTDARDAVVIRMRPDIPSYSPRSCSSTAGTIEHDSPAKLAAHAATGHGEMPAIGRPPASAR